MNTMTYESSAAARHRAFTLLELIISMAIIAILLTLVIAPLHRIQNSANRTDSLGALRQMALAYASYSADHRQRLMPGYVDSSLMAMGEMFEGLSAKLPTGEPLSADDTQAYVWRLAPYLDGAWETMFVDYHDNQLRSRLDQEFRCGILGPGTASEPCDLADAPLLIADIPSFGMNSIFVGGDSFHGGMLVKARNPWTPALGLEDEILAATRLSEVRNPATLIVFGAAARADPSGGDETYASEERLGYVELRAPLTIFNSSASTWTNRQWEVGKNLALERTPVSYAGPTGLPVARWGADKLPVAHLDASTAVEEISTLSSDMRRWSPFAFGLVPPPVAPMTP